MDNLLLEKSTLPRFSAIKPEHIEPAITKLIKENRETLELLLQQNQQYTWDNLIQQLEDRDELLNRAWSPVNHLHSVADNDALRESYNACLPLLTEYGSELGQHRGLFDAY